MTEQKYPTELLLNSAALAKYQPDFARAVLTKSEYTKAEAIRLLERFFKGGK